MNWKGTNKIGEQNTIITTNRHHKHKITEVICKDKTSPNKNKERRGNRRRGRDERRQKET